MYDLKNNNKSHSVNNLKEYNQEFNVKNNCKMLRVEYKTN